jgi:hypothetical protein
VRPEHVILHGNIFSYAEPPSEGLPGEPIMCRCSANPVFADILAQLDGEPVPTPDETRAARNEPERASSARQPEDVARGREQAQVPPAPTIEDIQTAMRDLNIESPNDLIDTPKLPAGFAHDATVDGTALFDKDPKVNLGVPTFKDAKKTPYRENVYSLKPSDLTTKKLYGIDTGGELAGDTRTQSVRDAWKSGTAMAPIEIDITKDGDYFIADGNHRFWAAIREGDKDIAVRFRPVESSVRGMDSIQGRAIKMLKREP